MEEYFDAEYLIGSRRIGDEIELAPGLVGILDGQLVEGQYMMISVVIDERVIVIDNRGS